MIVRNVRNQLSVMVGDSSNNSETNPSPTTTRETGSLAVAACNCFGPNFRAIHEYIQPRNERWNDK